MKKFIVLHYMDTRDLGSHGINLNMERFDGSDYSQSFYAPFVPNGQLSNYTAERIESAPMFRPFDANAKYPTPADGIIPVGVVLMK